VFKRLAPAALALSMACASTLVLAKPPVHTQSSGLTTLKSDYANLPDGWQWQDGGDSQSSFTAVKVIQDGTQVSGAEPLSSAGSAPDQGAASPVDHGHGAHLPEPSTGILLIVGLGTIGFALRGLVAANRRIARLEAAEDA
jgi:hypothetical protein